MTDALIKKLQTHNIELLECCDASARVIRRALTNMLKSQKYSSDSIVIRELSAQADLNEQAVQAAKNGWQAIPNQEYEL